MKWVVVVTIVVALAVGAYVAFRLLSGEQAGERPQAQGAKPEEVRISLCFLLKEPRTLSRDGVAACADRAFGVTFDTTGSGPPPRLWGDGGTYFFVLEEDTFIVISAPHEVMRYPRDDFPADFEGQPVYEAVAAHRAWLSVDVTVTQEKKAESYRIIGKMLAEFAGPDCLAVYCDELERCVNYDEKLVELLRSDDPLAMFR